MDCPKCIGKLDPKTITVREMHKYKTLQGAALTFDLTLDQCFVCGGVWFDQGEFEKYKTEGLTSLDARSVGSDLDTQLDKKKGKCPVCHVEMTQKPLPENSRIQIDACLSCGGIWLDSTEIDRVEKAVSQNAKGAISKFFAVVSAFRKPQA